MASGYLTQLGIHHKNEYNQFNFSCDLMEPFRFIVDDMAERFADDEMWKESMISILSTEFVINGKLQTLSNAINIYCFVLSFFWC